MTKTACKHKHYQREKMMWTERGKENGGEGHRIDLKCFIQTNITLPVVIEL